MSTTPHSFVSREGDEWHFEFSPETGLATVSGSDVGWKHYPVVEGVGYELILSREEASWLLSAWTDATSGHPAATLYIGKDTEFRAGPKSCWLSNSFCPICLQQRREFEVHHCIAAADGGPDSASNLLAICNSCHAVITRGSIEDRLPKATAALNHQLMYFGLQLFEDALHRPGKRTKRLFSSWITLELKETLDACLCEPELKLKLDQQLKKHSRIEYQYRRDLGLGKWPWREFEERHLNQMQFEAFLSKTLHPTPFNE